MNKLWFFLGLVIMTAVCLHFVKDDINNIAVKMQYNRNLDVQAYTKAIE